MIIKNQAILINRWLVFTVFIFFAAYNYSLTAGELHSISITPNNTTVQVGTAKTFACEGKDTQGNNVILQNPNSKCSGGTITVNHDPLTGITSVTYTANSVGQHYFEVWDAAVTGPPGDPGAIWGSADITNSTDSPQIASIIISPSSVNLTASGTQQFTSEGKDQYNNTFDNYIREWSATGGTITSNGVYTAGQQSGNFEVECTAQGTNISGTASIVIPDYTPHLASIIVSPSSVNLTASGTQQFTSEGKDQYNNTFDNYTREWTATGGTITSNGVYTAGQQSGNFEVECTAQGTNISGTASIVIPDYTPHLASIIVSPSSVNMEASTQQEFVAGGKDQNGNTFDNYTKEWSATGGTITSNGVYTAGQQSGNFEVKCTAQGTNISGTASIVIPDYTPHLASIIISPSSVNMSAGTQQEFVAGGKDQHGNPYSLNHPHWAINSTNPNSRLKSNNLNYGNSFGNTEKSNFTNNILADSTLIVNGETCLFSPIEAGEFILTCCDTLENVKGEALITVTDTTTSSFNVLEGTTVLGQNFPNPFNAKTVIPFTIKTNSHVILQIFSVDGKLKITLLNKNCLAGFYAQSFDRKNLPSGIYYYQLKAGKFVLKNKMVIR